MLLLKEVYCSGQDSFIMPERRFSTKVIQELENLTLPDLQSREQVLGFTIDSEPSLDLDDAIWIEAKNAGALISVHIADVTSVIPMWSAIDSAAIERIETRYYTNSTNPMLPPELAHNKLSLLEGQVRPTITIRISINQNAEIVETDLALTWLSSLKKFSYDKADAAMAQPESEFFHILRYCDTWSQKLNWKRRMAGAFGGTTIGGMFFNEDGKPDEIIQYSSQRIVQEFMILANTAIAELAAKNHLPILYRNHTATVIAPEQKTMIESLASLGMPQLIRAKLGSWLNPATYNPHLIGHFALCLGAYTHFTSPIRRLADYINHRILKAVLLEQKKSPYSVEDLTNLGDKINIYRQEIKQANNDFFEGQRHRQAEKTIKTQDTLSHLSTKEFSQVIKTGLKMGKLETVIPEAINRLENRSLKPLDIYCLAFAEYPESDEKNQIYEALIKAFADHPPSATQILQIASQQTGKKIDYIESKSHRGDFVVWCVFGEKTTFNPSTGRSKQETKHAASREWFQGLFSSSLVALDERNINWEMEEVFEEDDENDYDENDYDEEDYDEDDYGEDDFVSGINNPIGYLQDNLPLIGIPAPTYDFRSSNHGWECTCSVMYDNNMITAVKKGNNKKEAKHKAAQGMIAKLDDSGILTLLP